jgi:hypothetical protein
MPLDPDRTPPEVAEISIILSLEIGNSSIDAKDLRKLYFIEDIFSFSITGKIIIIDRIGLLEYGPLTGSETLTIIFGEDDVELEFDIFKINKVSQLAQTDSSTQNLIELLFVDKMFFYLTQKRYNISWTDTLASDIVKHIGTHMLNETTFKEFEASKETFSNFYMPYWTPQEALSWIMKRSSGATSGQAGYLFYNNNLGTNFCTIDKLMNDDPAEKEIYIHGGKDIYYRNKILGWSISGIDSNALRGVKGGHRMGYDFSTKSLLDNSYTYSSEIANHTMLGKSTLFQDISDSTIDYRLEGESDTKLLDNIYNHEFIKRYSVQQGISIIVVGSSHRYAGGLIEIDWPSSFKSQKLNKPLKGLYLIKSITHQFAGNQTPGWIQKLVLIKNAYTELEIKKIGQLVKATKTNIFGSVGSLGG